MGIPVENGLSSYDTIMNTWKEAMTTIDSLVSGMPQSIQSGAILLGLASWHLYPDMSVQGPRLTEVRQKDHLVRPGGIITLGLLWKDPEKDGGVRWSMPLSHLRYYGRAVESTRVVNAKSSRVSFPELVQVALGSLTSLWGPYFEDRIAASGAIIAVYHELLRTEETRTTASHRSGSQTENEKSRKLSDSGGDERSSTLIPSWLSFLSRHAEMSINSASEMQNDLQRLFALGQRRCAAFLGSNKGLLPPLFGLTDPQTLIGLIASMEEKIEFLREMASYFTDDPEEMIIRYNHPERPQTYMPEKLRYEYTTLLPQRDDGIRGLTHKRWVLSSREFLPDPWAVKRSIELLEKRREPCGVLFHGAIVPLQSSREDQNSFLKKSRFFPIEVESEWNNSGITSDTVWGSAIADLMLGASSQSSTNTSANTYLNFVWDTSQALFHLDQLKGSLRRNLHPETRQGPQEEGWIAEVSHPFPGESCHYQFIYGDPSTAAIFKRNSFRQTPEVPPIGTKATPQMKGAPTEIPIEQVLQLLRGQKLDRGLLTAEILRLDKIGDESIIHGQPNSQISSKFSDSLRALEAASVLYESISNATVHLGVTTKSLALTSWARYINSKGLDRISALSAISYFETGFLDLEPDHFDQVFALSSGNSLFVVDHLLRDPWDLHPQKIIRRVIGNVGKPGLCLLISPGAPDMKEPTLEEWSVINHQEFDGKFEGNFGDTSLQLSLTGYELPIKRNHGSRVQEASYVEAVVSAHDQGEWVADLNILKNASCLWKTPPSCSHPTPENWVSAGIGTLVSVDNWNELLDPPKHIAIARATGSWLARTALSTVGLQMGYIVILTPEVIDQQKARTVCWSCVSSIIAGNRAVDNQAKVLVIT
jgi:hypothetical protein